jgi:hypothetical protein
MMRPRDTALRLGATEKTLANWRRQDRGSSFVRLGGPAGRGAIRYEVEAVEAWLAVHHRSDYDEVEVVFCISAIPPPRDRAPSSG